MTNTKKVPTSVLLESDREAQTDSRRMLENLPDGVARLDATGRYAFVNRAVSILFGCDVSGFIGRTLDQAEFAPGMALPFRSSFDAVVASRETREFSFSMPRGARNLHFQIVVIPELDDRNRLISVLMVARDVTQQTEAQLERDALLVREQASRMQAEAAARVRDEFLAIVSHELRSPLNGIQSWTHVLEAYVPMDQPLVERAVAGIKLGVQQQVRLIEDLLDATLIMSGKLRLSKEAVAVESCIDAAISSVAALAAEKNIVVTKRVMRPIDAVEIDGKRIEQVVWNLLSNAVKFTPEGGTVQVSLDVHDDQLQIAVEDNGRGIPAQFLPYLFDPFRQADESSTRRAGGIGIGLTLVRRLTELHGGHVKVESQGENRGSVFRVALPLQLADRASPEQPTVKRSSDDTLASLHGIRVTLVDDLKEARDSLAQLLLQAGASVESFSSGKEVSAALAARSGADRPDVMICDIAMPEQDGYRTLQQIREDEDARQQLHVPAVALTAFSQREDKLKALASGFQVHLAKPVDPAEIIAILAALAARDDRI
jgi:signal transduction histidine kinase/ActR/RegA family two-component response regulator